MGATDWVWLALGAVALGVVQFYGNLFAQWLVRRSRHGSAGPGAQAVSAPSSMGFGWGVAVGILAAESLAGGGKIEVTMGDLVAMARLFTIGTGIIMVVGLLICFARAICWSHSPSAI